MSLINESQRQYELAMCWGIIRREQASGLEKDAEIERLQKSVAELEQRWEQQRHAANEWADTAVNGLQWLRNIKDGFGKIEVAVMNMEDQIAHCRKVAAPSPEDK